MLHKTPLRERARGFWCSLLPQLGIPHTFLTGKHGPCPMCGGKDRWRFDNKEGYGSWYCNKCGAGDGISLIRKKRGCDFREAAEAIERIVGKGLEREQTNKTDYDRRKRLNDLWRSGKPVVQGDPTARYLFSRAGVTTFPSSLRTVSACYCSGMERRLPAMIAMLTDVEGKPATIHRTYLTEHGRKAEIENPRRMMPGKIARGAAVRLTEVGDEIGIAEGIETAFSVIQLFGRPCWAATNAALLSNWAPPGGTRRIIIYGDNDEDGAGQVAAYSLQKRLASLGLQVTVEIPPTPGEDWNDVLIRERMEARPCLSCDTHNQEGKTDGTTLP